MQLKRKIGLVASLASLLLALPVAAQGADSQARGLNWRSDKDALPGTVMYSQIRQGSADVSTACVGGFNDKNCDAKTASLLVNNFLPTCDLEKILDCIDTVSWIKSDGTVVVGKQTKVRGSAWDDYAYARNETLRVNKPTLPGIFTFTGLAHSKGSDFAVTAHIATPIKAGVVSDPDISLVILPVYLVAGLDPADDSECLTANTSEVDTVCYKSAPMDEDPSFKMTLKLVSRPQGWMAGRVVNPSVTFTAPTADEKRTLVTLQGSSMKVQTIDRTYLSTNADQKAAWEKILTVISDSRAPWSSPGDVMYPLPPDKTSVGIFNSIVTKDATFDTADALKTVWRIDLQPKGRADGLTSCDSSDFQGFVSSNAMVFKSALPNFDKTTGTLDYTVSSPHYKPDGKTAFEGRYDLLVATPFARCVWNLKAGEIPAKDVVTVTVQKGDETKVINAELSLDENYFRFTASGFTFSQAKLSIKLKPKEAITPTAPTTPAAPAPAPAAATPSAKATTITCVKGKTTKKVTAVKPTCPAGFKKK